jgi:hypothetical protein
LKWAEKAMHDAVTTAVQIARNIPTSWKRRRNIGAFAPQ